MNKILVLVHTLGYAVDGYDIIAAFTNKQTLDDYIKKTYPDAEKDDDGDYYYKHYFNNNSKNYEEHFLLIHEVDLHEQ